MKDQHSHFWNSCPCKFEYVPLKPCSFGKPVNIKDGRIVTDPQCPWWINSKKHNYCFWRYIKDNSQADGSMRELLQADLAQLFGCSSTKIHFMLKEAIKELTEAIKNSDIMDMDFPDENITKSIENSYFDIDHLEDIDDADYD